MYQFTNQDNYEAFDGDMHRHEFKTIFPYPF